MVREYRQRGGRGDVQALLGCRDHFRLSAARHRAPPQRVFLGHGSTAKHGLLLHYAKQLLRSLH
jgi:hypothetical protein